MTSSGKKSAIFVAAGLALLLGLSVLGLQRWYGHGLLAGDAGLDITGPVEAVATLHRLYPIFTDPEEREGMSLEQRRAVETEFQELLQQLPLDLLLPQMEKYSVAYSSQVERFDDPQAFVLRLSQVAMNGIITPLEAETPGQGPVRFERRAADLRDLRVFEAGNKTIFALFDSSAYADTRVLVKWYHADSGRVVLFKQFEISAGDSNYIWIDNNNGFEAGNYRVEIYRVNETLSLLSSGEYRVEG